MCVYIERHPVLAFLFVNGLVGHTFRTNAQDNLPVMTSVGLNPARKWTSIFKNILPVLHYPDRRKVPVLPSLPLQILKPSNKQSF